MLLKFGCICTFGIGSFIFKIGWNHRIRGRLHTLLMVNRKVVTARLNTLLLMCYNLESIASPTCIVGIVVIIIVLESCFSSTSIEHCLIVRYVIIYWTIYLGSMHPNRYILICKLMSEIGLEVLTSFFNIVEMLLLVFNWVFLLHQDLLIQG